LPFLRRYIFLFVETFVRLQRQSELHTSLFDRTTKKRDRLRKIVMRGFLIFNNGTKKVARAFFCHRQGDQIGRIFAQIFALGRLLALSSFLKS
jgi:hypothetical protein